MKAKIEQIVNRSEFLGKDEFKANNKYFVGVAIDYYWTLLVKNPSVFLLGKIGMKACASGNQKLCDEVSDLANFIDNVGGKEKCYEIITKRKGDDLSICLVFDIPDDRLNGLTAVEWVKRNLIVNSMSYVEWMKELSSKHTYPPYDKAIDDYCTARQERDLEWLRGVVVISVD
jgi:hypothetical protein